MWWHEIKPGELYSTNSAAVVDSSGQVDPAERWQGRDRTLVDIVKSVKVYELCVAVMMGYGREIVKTGEMTAKVMMAVTAVRWSRQFKHKRCLSLCNNDATTYFESKVAVLKL